MRHMVCLLFVAMLCAVVIVAQQSGLAPASGASNQGQQPIRVTTHLVVEEVTVKDKNGKPMEGLTTNDFVLTEDGAPQTISFIEFQRLQAPSNSAEPASWSPSATPRCSVGASHRGCA